MEQIPVLSFGPTHGTKHGANPLDHLYSTRSFGTRSSHFLAMQESALHSAMQERVALSIRLEQYEKAGKLQPGEANSLIGSATNDKINEILRKLQQN